MLLANLEQPHKTPRIQASDDSDFEKKNGQQAAD